MATHKHWPKDHPRYESAPVCDLPTKKACDERWRKKRGEAVRFGKEDWVAMQEKRRQEDATKLERMELEHRLATERHVENILDGA